MKVAYIGLGSMGGDQAQLIAASDFDLTVYDPFPAAMERFETKAQLAKSVADAAEGADVLQVCVRDDAQVDDVLFGESGAAETLASGSVVVVHSTVRIDTVKTLSERLAMRGVTLIDAPVSRTRRDASGPFVFTMGGGDTAAFERLRPLFQVFSTDVQHVGPIGAGMALKITNNFVTWVQLVAGLQSMQLSENYGVPFDALSRLMETNGNLTPTMSAAMSGMLKSVPGTDTEVDSFRESQTGIGEKDLALAMELGAASGIDTQLAASAQALLRPLFAGSA